MPVILRVALRQNGGNHDYHSLHLVVERKLNNGLYYQFGWTWAKALTDVQLDGEAGTQPENSYACFMERSDTDYVPRHRMVANALGDNLGPRCTQKLTQAIVCPLLAAVTPLYPK